MKNVLLVIATIVSFLIILSIIRIIRSKRFFKKLEKIFYYFDRALLSIKPYGKDNLKIGYTQNLFIDHSSEVGYSSDNVNIGIIGYYKDDKEAKLLLLKRLYLVILEDLNNTFYDNDTINLEILNKNNAIYFEKLDDGSFDIGCGNVSINEFKLGATQDYVIRIINKVLKNMYYIMSLKGKYRGCYVLDWSEYIEVLSAFKEKFNQLVEKFSEEEDE